MPRRCFQGRKDFLPVEEINLTGRLPLVSGRGKGHAASQAGFYRQHRIDVGIIVNRGARASPFTTLQERRSFACPKAWPWNGAIGVRVNFH